MALDPHISLLKGVGVVTWEGVVEGLRTVTVQEHGRQKRSNDESNFIAPISLSYYMP